MAFQVIVNDVDRTAYIEKGSLEINDALTSQVDILSFSIKQKDWLPSKNDIIIVNRGDTPTRIFGGRIVDVNKSDQIYRYIEVEAQDWSVDLDRKLIAKVFNNMSAKEIIEDIVATVNAELGTEFTTDNVQDGIEFGKVVFNYLPASKCIEQLANTLNWSWYIDPQMDIHFFAKGQESAPFDVTDDSPNIIQETLEFDDSFSELRNTDIVRGGEFVANPRSESYIADGTQLIVNLGYKFATLPTVTVEGVPIDLGVENLDNQDLEDDLVVALWDYNQKYLRFKTAPTLGDEIEVTGNPLFPLIVLADDENSRNEYGIKEHLIVDKDIVSQDLAVQRAIADLEAYADGVQGGEFETYTDGLRTGQAIYVNSTKLDVQGTFLVRAVKTSEHGNSGAKYTIKLANNKIFGIIELLQRFLLLDKRALNINENEVPNIIKLDRRTVLFAEQITKIEPEIDHKTIEFEESIRFDPFDAEFVIGPYFPVDDADPKTPMRIGISSYIY